MIFNKDFKIYRVIIKRYSLFYIIYKVDISNYKKNKY